MREKLFCFQQNWKFAHTFRKHRQSIAGGTHLSELRQTRAMYPERGTTVVVEDPMLCEFQSYRTIGQSVLSQTIWQYMPRRIYSERTSMVISGGPSTPPGSWIAWGNNMWGALSRQKDTLPVSTIHKVRHWRHGQHHVQHTGRSSRSQDQKRGISFIQESKAHRLPNREDGALCAILNHLPPPPYRIRFPYRPGVWP